MEQHQIDQQQLNDQNDYGQEIMDGGMEEGDQEYDIGMYDQEKHHESQEESKEALKSKFCETDLIELCVFRNRKKMVLGLPND